MGKYIIFEILNKFRRIMVNIDKNSHVGNEFLLKKLNKNRLPKYF